TPVRPRWICVASNHEHLCFRRYAIAERAATGDNSLLAITSGTKVKTTSKGKTFSAYCKFWKRVVEWRAFFKQLGNQCFKRLSLLIAYRKTRLRSPIFRDDNSGKCSTVMWFQF